MEESIAGWPKRIHNECNAIKTTKNKILLKQKKEDNSIDLVKARKRSEFETFVEMIKLLSELKTHINFTQGKKCNKCSSKTTKFNQNELGTIALFQ